MTKPKILVVDSDEGFGLMLKEGLESSGYYTADWAQTGKEALKTLADDSYDLVIVDMGIDDISALILVHTIRTKIDENMRVMMIPLIGQDLPEKTSRLNINGALSKPFFVGDLPELIDKALGRSPSNRPEATPPKPKPESKPKPKASSAKDEKPKPSTQVTSTSSEESEKAKIQALKIVQVPKDTISYLRANENEILRLLDDLNREVRAEAILLIAGSELISNAGMLGRENCRELAGLVAQSSQAAAQAASFLGEQAGRFAQSLHEGREYRLYTLTLSEGILLSLALSSNVPLGMIRHQCRQIAEQLSKFIIIS